MTKFTFTFPFQDTGENIWVQIKRHTRSRYKPWCSMPFLTRILSRLFGDYPLDMTDTYNDERGQFVIKYQLYRYDNEYYFYKFGGE